MFALCKTCADTGNQTPCTHSDAERAIQGTWCSVEVMKALEKGYRIIQLHEVWHFPQKTDTLFKEYIDTFAKIKLEASGYPKDCVTDEQKQWYVNDIWENQGIQLDPTQIVYNPGLRALTKLMLNSFGGKFAQRSNLVKTEQIDDPQVFFDCLTSDEITVLDANLVSDEIIEIRYEYGENFVQPDPKTNGSLPRSPPRMLDYNSTKSSTCYKNACCTMIPTRSSISANLDNPNLDWATILAI